MGRRRPERLGKHVQRGRDLFAREVRARVEGGHEATSMTASVTSEREHGSRAARDWRPGPQHRAGAGAPPSY
jgi:hypothetical protein